MLNKFKNLKKTAWFFVLVAFAFTTTAMAQATGEPTNCENGWCWGEDPGVAKEKYAVFTDALNSKELERSEAALNWLLENTPKLNEALYVKAITLYEEKEAATQDAAQKIAAQDKILSFYDIRLNIYGERLDVLERKARKVYPYLIARQDRYKDIYTFYHNMIDKYASEITFSGSFIYYFDIMCRVKDGKEVTDELVMEAFDEHLPALEKNSASNKYWQAAKDQIEGLVQGCVKIDCDFVRKNLAPKLEANKGDIAFAKKILGYMINGNCGNTDPLFISTAELVFNAEPSSGFALLLAKNAMRENKLGEALNYFNKAIGLYTSDEKDKKAQTYMDIAKIHNSQDRYADARRYAFLAAEADATLASDAYSMVGDLYMKSFKQCVGNGNPVESRYVFLAAYDMYAKAGNNKGMANAKEQFPAMSDIFSYGPGLGVEEGSTVTVGCWINVSTTLRRR